MRRLTRATALALLILGGSSGFAADDGLTAFRGLHGRWRDDAGRQFLFDLERMQGNVDSRRPFDRQPLVVHDISGDYVVFSIAAQRLVARVEPERLQFVGLDGNAPTVFRRIAW